MELRKVTQREVKWVEEALGTKLNHTGNTPYLRTKKWQAAQAWIDLLEYFPVKSGEEWRRGKAFRIVSPIVCRTFKDFDAAVRGGLLERRDTISDLVDHIVSVEDFVDFVVDHFYCDSISNTEVLTKLFEHFDRLRPKPNDWIDTIGEMLHWCPPVQTHAWIGLFLTQTEASRDEWEKFLVDFPARLKEAYKVEEPETWVVHTVVMRVATLALHRTSA